MRARGVSAPEAYAALLDRDPHEYDLLLRTLTINVSRFFRNRETWEAIRERVLPDLLRLRGQRLNAWSAGSAGGEEAYSLAILVWEWLESRGRRPWSGIQIIGTDIDEGSLELARRAEFGPLALIETPATTRRRWFTAAPPHRLDQSIRSRVQFQRLDILAERPVFEADLVLCRNLLIYVDRAAQSQVFRTFSSVLRPGGYLVLGRVETLDPEARDSFEAVDARERIYRRR
jgi:chemotaxis methyl-accepting protein methylase